MLTGGPTCTARPRGMHTHRALDLASNALQVVDGLEGLVRLERLSVAHNRITSLAGLSDIQGSSLTCTVLLAPRGCGDAKLW